MTFFRDCGCKFEILETTKDADSLGRIFICPKHRGIEDARERIAKKYIPEYHRINKTYARFVKGKTNEND